jgi:AmmeMemoRadiSam system protein B
VINTFIRFPTGGLLSLLLCGTVIGAEPPYPSFHQSASPFRDALEKTREVRPLPQSITGATVPHHLLAAELTASTLRLAAGKHPERIILLTPDHFHRSKRPFATTNRDFLTPYGRVPTDTAAAEKLLGCPLVEKSNLFSHEHGAQAVLPFIAKLFPGTPVLPVALGVRTTKSQWRTLVTALTPLVGTSTLIIQSTDFSHYLPAPTARLRDQETLRAITTGCADAIIALDQPDHMDSKAAQWLMTTLQQQCHHAFSTVVDNRNAIEFGGSSDEPRTTSYITQLWSAKCIAAATLSGDAWYFGGDTHFGRHLAPALADPAETARIDQAILSVTRGKPVIINLEGVMLEKVPPAHPMQIGMETRTSLERMEKWNVRGAILANNHTLDFGRPALDSMKRDLANAGVRSISDGECVDFGLFRLGAASDVMNSPEPAMQRITRDVISRWKGGGRDARATVDRASCMEPSLFTFFHCGREYSDAPGKRERTLAGWADEAGAALVLGCHPHRPSPAWENSGVSLRRYSLGNLLFDQTDPKNTGGLVEVRFFHQGTWSARWIPLENLHAP